MTAGQTSPHPVRVQFVFDLGPLGFRLVASGNATRVNREVAELRDQLATAHGELRAAKRRRIIPAVVDLSQRRQPPS